METNDARPGQHDNFFGQIFEDNFLKKLLPVTESAALIKKYLSKCYRYVVGVEPVLLDTDGTILKWNKTCEKLQGYTEPEILGQSLAIFYLPQDRQLRLPEKLIQIATEKGTAVHRGRWVRKNGSTF